MEMLVRRVLIREMDRTQRIRKFVFITHGRKHCFIC